MKEYQIRVVEEKISLDKKIKKLTDFLLLKSVKIEVPQKESDLLRKQLLIMREYSDCLSARIQAFSCDSVFFKEWTLLMLKQGII